MTVQKLPEGVTIDLNFYLASSEGLEVRVHLNGLGCLPIMEEAVDVGRIARTMPIFATGTGWRMMTRDEIADYRRREEEGDDEDSDES